MPVYQSIHDRPAGISDWDAIFSGKEETWRLREITRKLREPGGCEWDRKQNHQSMRASLVEEAYEVIDAIDRDNAEDLKEELGDLLFLVFFHARLAEERGVFGLTDVARGIADKLVRRHPHVFGDHRVENVEQILENWENIKEREREESGKQTKGRLDGVPASFPALLRACKVQQKAARAGFDWPEIGGVYEKLREEIQEVRDVSENDSKHLEEEAGDLLFAAVNLCRWLRVDPESALQAATDKFTRRFHGVERRVQATGERMEELSIDELENFWQETKATEE